jgi:uncharacterized RDD family membrane protein YckC
MLAGMSSMTAVGPMNSGNPADITARRAGALALGESPVPEQVDLEYRIETPENVILTYQLAGPASRFSAWLIDLFFRIVIVIVVQVAILVPLGWFSVGVSVGSFLILLFLIDWGYYALSEGLFRGQTVGKRIYGLRVIHEEGYPLTIWGAILRNLVRAGDALPAYGIPCYGVGFLSMMISGRFRRLGDLVARTIVVAERRPSVPRMPLILERIQPLPRAEISGSIPAARTLTLIEKFLSRRHVLTHRRGHAMALVLARVLAKKLRYSGDRQLVEEYPMAFLARLYVTFYRSPEEGPEARLSA